MMRTVNCVVNGIRPILDTAPLGPLLGPLQNNGGPTQTHALLAGSRRSMLGTPPAAGMNLGLCLRPISAAFAARWTVIETGRRDAILEQLSLVMEPESDFTPMWTLMGTGETTLQCTGTGRGLSFGPLMVE